LDEDDSGGLVFEEFRARLTNMHVKDPTTEDTTFGIHLTPDDFDLISNNGQLLSDEGEFNQQQFRKMMLGELQRYTRRTLRNAVVLSNNQEFHSTIMLIKLLEQSVFEKIKEKDVMMEKFEQMQEHVHEALAEITSFCRQQQQQKMPAVQPAVTTAASRHIPLYKSANGRKEEGN
jgi:hypothetical protein